MTARYFLPSGLELKGVHPTTECAGRTCIIHSPTDHHMVDWPLTWRPDRAIFERTCEHGIGHPDPDQYDYWNLINQMVRSVHGCDGCCL